jgi:predicted ArsR family transcriptional regulator
VISGELVTRSDDRDPRRSPTPAHTLPTKQRIVLEIILQYYRVTGEPCSASRIARRMGLHHKTVQEHFRKLYEHGWLTTAGGPATPRDTT